MHASHRVYEYHGLHAYQLQETCETSWSLTSRGLRNPNLNLRNQKFMNNSK